MASPFETAPTLRSGSVEHSRAGVASRAPAAGMRSRGRMVPARVRHFESFRALGLVSAALLTVCGAPAVAAQTVDVSGQIRPRIESRDPFGPEGEARSYTIGRTRLNASVSLDRGVWGFVQLQDVRIWGEESSTVGDFRADGLDLHQGFLQIGADSDPQSVRLGRFEQNYGGERLIGAVGWAQQGRAFDGVRARLHRSPVVVDGFRFQLSESASPFRDREASLLGSYLVWSVAEGQALDTYAFYLDEDLEGGDTELLTAGVRYAGAASGWSYRFEGTLQRGERAARDVDAYMVAGRVGRSVAAGKGSITLWVDHLSGGDPTDPEADDEAFDTLFGTNHKFYGFADLFLDPAGQTSGRGLQDLAVKTAWTLAEGWRLTADLHRFRVVADEGLSTALLGDEIDVVLTHSYTDGLTFSGGLAWVGAGDALAPVRGIDEDVRFAYLMIDLVF